MLNYPTMINSLTPERAPILQTCTTRKKIDTGYPFIQLKPGNFNKPVLVRWLNG